MNQNKKTVLKKETKYDFIYPASFMKHKNHKILFDILIELSKENIFPKVLLTLDQKSLKKINFNKVRDKYNLSLFNRYEPDQKRFLKIYKECKYLLYLSNNETIGLPLLEAYSYGLKTIAPDLTYSSQFIQPDYFFNINSKEELKNIILKCMHQKDHYVVGNKNFKNIKN